MDQRLLAAVRHPHLARRDLGQRLGQLVPIGMVAQDQRQLDVLLPRALADAHPARCHRGDRVGQPPRPAVVERAGRTHHDVPRHLRLCRARRRPQLAQAYAQLLVQVAQPLQRAVQVDRRLVAALAQLGDHPLRLAQRIGADDHAPLRIGVQTRDQLVDLVARVGVPEDGQREGRLGHEHVALHRFEGRAGRVGAALVVARDHHPLAAMVEHDLRRSQHMARRHEADLDVAQPDRLAIRHRLARLRPVARFHDRQRLGRRPHPPVAAARMVGMAVGDERAGARLGRVDPRVGGRHVDAVRVRLQPVSQSLGPFGHGVNTRHGR